jgi:homoserine O-succinyltransferase/O-acetyltransferase
MAQLSPPRHRPAGRRNRRDPLVIGLINNMPDKALASTERQFRALLHAAAGELPISLRLFALAEVPRSDAGRRHIASNYEDIAALREADLDGLIVTGTEPRGCCCVADEPCWRTLTQLVDWAADAAVPSIWSCLAAHAAVYYLDGVPRRTLSAKMSGVFECVRTTDHPIADGMVRWSTPHSRLNELPTADLVAQGYDILSVTADGGVDLFTARHQPGFLFTQGHPEYDAEALLREYRRDVGRFLAGTIDHYPEIPDGYLDRAALDALLTFRDQALAGREIVSIEGFPFAIARRKLTCFWRKGAVRLYANWLSCLAAECSAGGLLATAQCGGPSRRAAGSRL